MDDGSHSIESSYVPGESYVPWAPAPFAGCPENLMMCLVGCTSLRCRGGQQGAVNELGALRLNTSRPCDHPGTRHLSLLFKAQDHNFCLLKL